MPDFPIEDFEIAYTSIPGLYLIGNRHYWCLEELNIYDISGITPELVTANPKSFTFEGFKFSLDHPAVAGCGGAAAVPQLVRQNAMTGQLAKRKSPAYGDGNAAAAPDARAPLGTPQVSPDVHRTPDQPVRKKDYRGAPKKRSRR